MIDLLQLAIHRRNKLLDPTGKLTPLFFATELGGEVGEALNCIKKLEREALDISGSRSSLEALRNELADIIICTLLVANAYNITSLEDACIDKFNDSSCKWNLPRFAKLIEDQS